jgi:phage gpG-like protein
MKIQVKNANLVKDLEKKIKDVKKREVAIGVMQNSGAYEDGLSIVEVARTHEFGSITKKIPARSFLRVPFYEKEKQVDNLIFRGYKMMVEKNETVDKALDLIGLGARDISVGAFRDNNWQELKPSTIKAKGSSAPLIDTGNLRQSITWEVRNAQ